MNDHKEHRIGRGWIGGIVALLVIAVGILLVIPALPASAAPAADCSKIKDKVQKTLCKQGVTPPAPVTYTVTNGGNLTAPGQNSGSITASCTAIGDVLLDGTGHPTLSYTDANGTPYTPAPGSVVESFRAIDSDTVGADFTNLTDVGLIGYLTGTCEDRTP